MKVPEKAMTILYEISWSAYDVGFAAKQGRDHMRVGLVQSVWLT